MKQPEDNLTLDLALEDSAKKTKSRTKQIKLPDGFKLEGDTLTSPAGSTWGFDPATPARGRGRPPKGDAAMTAAQRQRDYRERLRFQAAGLYSEVIPEASTAALLESLRLSLQILDSDDASNKRARKTIAASTLREIATRYGIKL